MTWWILPSSCCNIVRRSVPPLLTEDINTNSVQQQLWAFELSIQSKIVDKVIDKYLDKSLVLQEITLDNLLEIHTFNKDNDIPLNWKLIKPDYTKPNADDFRAANLD